MVNKILKGTPTHKSQVDRILDGIRQDSRMSNADLVEHMNVPAVAPTRGTPVDRILQHIRSDAHNAEAVSIERLDDARARRLARIRSNGRGEPA